MQLKEDFETQHKSPENGFTVPSHHGMGKEAHDIVSFKLF